MPRYKPIAVDPEIQASLSDLLELKWRRNGLIADFRIPEIDGSALRVSFERVEILRVLDEMPLSTENESGANQGLVPEPFAYTVDDAAFWKSQSEALRSAIPHLRHFRFITGWACVDVISAHDPEFTVVSRNALGP